MDPNVTAMHGQMGLGHLTLDSVAEDMARRTSTPVLLFHAH